MFQFLFKEVKVHPIYSCHPLDNLASGGGMKHRGLKEAEYSGEAGLTHRQTYSSLMNYSILDSEYENFIKSSN